MGLLLSAEVTPAPAWSYGFLFGAPEQPRRRAARPRRMAPIAAPLAEVPLPVPRPPFPDDAPALTPPSPQVPEPRPTPLPPERPAAIAPGTGPTPPPDQAATQAPTPPSSTPPKPAVAPSGARLGEAPGQPEDDAACLGRLKVRNVVAAPIAIGPQPDVRCTVVESVRLEELTLPDGSKVSFPDRPTLACTTADAFSLYVRDLLSPLAKGTYGAPLAAVWTGPGLECRSRDHIFGAKLSAHGQGLAIDIAQLKLTDGRIIEVGQPRSDVDQGFETAARAAGCGYFHTVLGPGSDSYHRTHWHFDLEVRGAKGDSKFCR